MNQEDFCFLSLLCKLNLQSMQHILLQTVLKVEIEGGMKMKAIISEKYGTPDTLRLSEVDYTNTSAK